MKIIGHRGAAGLVDENTIESIARAVELGVDAVEIDVRATKDGELVLLHDSNFVRTTGIDLEVAEVNYKDVTKLRTHGGYKIPTLEQTLETFQDMPMFIEPKGSLPLKKFIEAIEKAGLADFQITTFKHELLIELKKLRPGWKFYPSSDNHAMRLIKFADSNGMTGVSIHYHLLNPWTYLYARHKKLNLMVYTVNSYWHIMFCGIFRRIRLCTNYPDRAKKTGFIK